MAVIDNIDRDKCKDGIDFKEEEGEEVNDEINKEDTTVVSVMIVQII